MITNLLCPIHTCDISQAQHHITVFCSYSSWSWVTHWPVSWTTLDISFFLLLHFSTDKTIRCCFLMKDKSNLLIFSYASLKSQDIWFVWCWCIYRSLKIVGWKVDGGDGDCNQETNHPSIDLEIMIGAVQNMMLCSTNNASIAKMSIIGQFQGAGGCNSWLGVMNEPCNAEPSVTLQRRWIFIWNIFISYNWGGDKILKRELRHLPVKHLEQILIIRTEVRQIFTFDDWCTPNR